MLLQEAKMKKLLSMFFVLLSFAFFSGCENSTLWQTKETPDIDIDEVQAEQPDENQNENASDADIEDPDPADLENKEPVDDDTAETEEYPEIPGTEEETSCNTDPTFCFGQYFVNTIDVASGDNGSPRQFRIYEPIGAEGKIPVVHFLHGFMYKISYYDRFLMQLASHGFIVVSSQSEHKMRNGDTTSQEAEKVAAFISWLKENLNNYVAVTPDFENLGLSGHSRGGKVTNRILNSDPTIAKSFFGVDPVDSKPPFSGFIGADDPESLSEPVMFTGGSMFLGTEKGPSGLVGIGNTGACAPEGGNSVNFYAAYPSPSRHIIAAGVGHADMVDPEDIKDCSVYCSTCAGSSDDGMKSMFITYTGGLMTAFFNVTLKGLTEYENILNDPSVYPFSTKTVEHK